MQVSPLPKVIEECPGCVFCSGTLDERVHALRCEMVRQRTIRVVAMEWCNGALTNFCVKYKGEHDSGDA